MWGCSVSPVATDQDAGNEEVMSVLRIVEAEVLLCILIHIWDSVLASLTQLLSSGCCLQSRHFLCGFVVLPSTSLFLIITSSFIPITLNTHGWCRVHKPAGHGSQSSSAAAPCLGPNVPGGHGWAVAK